MAYYGEMKIATPPQSVESDSDIYMSADETNPNAVAFANNMNARLQAIRQGRSIANMPVPPFDFPPNAIAFRRRGQSTEQQTENLAHANMAFQAVIGDAQTAAQKVIAPMINSMTSDIDQIEHNAPTTPQASGIPADYVQVISGGNAPDAIDFAVDKRYPAAVEWAKKLAECERTGREPSMAIQKQKDFPLTAIEYRAKPGASPADVKEINAMNTIFHHIPEIANNMVRALEQSQQTSTAKPSPTTARSPRQGF